MFDRWAIKRTEDGELTAAAGRPMTRSEAARAAAQARWGHASSGMSYTERLAALRAQKAAKKKAGGGKGKAAKPKASPEDKAAASAKAKADNAAAIGDELNNRDAALSKNGLAALSALAKGDAIDPAMADGLIKSGLAERGADGSIRLGPHGRSAVAGAEAGDIGKVLDAISRGSDVAARDKGREDKAAERTKAEETRKAEQDAKAKAAKQKAGGGGSKKQDKTKGFGEDGESLTKDDAVRAKGQSTAESVGLRRKEYDALRNSAEGTHVAEADVDGLAELGLVKASGDGEFETTDQGRRALTALERGDIRTYRAAVQDAKARMAREDEASNRTRQRKADQDAADDELLKRAKAGEKLTDRQRQRLIATGRGKMEGSMFRAGVATKSLTELLADRRAERLDGIKRTSLHSGGSAKPGRSPQGDEGAERRTTATSGQKKSGKKGKMGDAQRRAMFAKMGKSGSLNAKNKTTGKRTGAKLPATGGAAKKEPEAPKKELTPKEHYEKAKRSLKDASIKEQAATPGTPEHKEALARLNKADAEYTAAQVNLAKAGAAKPAGPPKSKVEAAADRANATALAVNRAADKEAAAEKAAEASLAKVLNGKVGTPEHDAAKQEHLENGKKLQAAKRDLATAKQKDTEAYQAYHKELKAAKEEHAKQKADALAAHAAETEKQKAFAASAANEAKLKEQIGTPHGDAPQPTLTPAEKMTAAGKKHERADAEYVAASKEWGDAHTQQLKHGPGTPEHAAAAQAKIAAEKKQDAAMVKINAAKAEHAAALAEHQGKSPTVTSKPAPGSAAAALPGHTPTVAPKAAPGTSTTPAHTVPAKTPQAETQKAVAKAQKAHDTAYAKEKAASLKNDEAQSKYNEAVKAEHAAKFQAEAAYAAHLWASDPKNKVDAGQKTAIQNSLLHAEQNLKTAQAAHKEAAKEAVAAHTKYSQAKAKTGNALDNLTQAHTAHAMAGAGLDPSSALGKIKNVNPPKAKTELQEAAHASKQANAKLGKASTKLAEAQDAKAKAKAAHDTTEAELQALTAKKKALGGDNPGTLNADIAAKHKEHMANKVALGKAQGQLQKAEAAHADAKSKAGAAQAHHENISKQAATAPKTPPAGSAAAVAGKTYAGAQHADISKGGIPAQSFPHGGGYEAMKGGMYQHASLSPAESSAVNSYQGSGYSVVNGYLRKPAGSLTPGEEAQAKALMTNLDTAIAKNMLTSNLQVHRGMVVSAPGALDRLAEMQVGKTYSDPGYLSTSLKQSTANAFGGSALPYGNTKAVSMKIRVPAGTHGLYMPISNPGGAYSGKGGEDELVLPRGLNYRVLSRVDTGNKVEMEVEVIG